MLTLDWIILGALLLGIMIFCARLARRGLSTLDDDRQKQQVKLNEGKRKLHEDCKNISAHEHFTILMAGVEDLLRLDGIRDECSVKRIANAIILDTPKGRYELELLMRERVLKSTQKVIHGRNLWVLKGDGIQKNFTELSSLMAALSCQLHGEAPTLATPEHIFRRLHPGSQAIREED